MPSPPFATWTDNDHSGPVIIATTLCLLYWLVAGFVQQAVSFANGIRFTWADSLFVASMASGFIQSVLVLAACHNGLGKSAKVLDRSDLLRAQQLYYVSNIFYAITLGLVKCSATCFVANLTVKNMGSLRHVPKKQKFTLYVVIGLAVAWAIGSAVTLGLPCDLSPPLVTDTTMCMGTVDRWAGIFAGDAVSDLAIVAYAASVIWATQASISKRLVWYIPFSVRICVPLWAGLRLLAMNHRKLTRDPTIGLWFFVIMTQGQILISLIGAASPALKKTMMDLMTNYGAQTESNSRSKPGSFPMNYLRSKNRTRPTDSERSQTIPYAGNAKGSALISKSRNEDKMTRDDDSQEGIIRQDDFEVSYDTSERYHTGQHGYGRMT